MRIPPRRATRSSDRHQEEKDGAILSARERKEMGEAETNFGMSIADQQFTATYDIINANEELAKALNVDLGTPLLRRKWASTDPKTDRLVSTSVSASRNHSWRVTLRCWTRRMNRGLADDAPTVHGWNRDHAHSR